MGAACCTQCGCPYSDVRRRRALLSESGDESGGESGGESGESGEFDFCDLDIPDVCADVPPFFLCDCYCNSDPVAYCNDPSQFPHPLDIGNPDPVCCASLELPDSSCVPSAPAKKEESGNLINDLFSDQPASSQHVKNVELSVSPSTEIQIVAFLLVLLLAFCGIIYCFKRKVKRSIARKHEVKDNEMDQGVDDI